MARERVSPLVMQMKYISSSGALGFNIYEHRGDSGTWYMDKADVDKGVLKVGHRQVPEDPELIALHRDETLSEYTKDGVPVELVERDDESLEMADAQVRNDEY